MFFTDVLYEIYDVSFYSWFVKNFYHQWVLHSVKCFSSLIEMICGFSLSFCLCGEIY